MNKPRAPGYVGKPDELPLNLQHLCDRLNEMFNEDDTPDELCTNAREAIELLWEERDQLQSKLEEATAGFQHNSAKALEHYNRAEALQSRLSRGLERIERLRDWIQDRADEECPYGEMDFESCGHNRRHGICSGHAAAKVLAQDTFVSEGA